MMKDVGFHDEFLESFISYFGLDKNEVTLNHTLIDLDIDVEQIEDFLIEEYDATGDDLSRVMPNIKEEKSIAEIYEAI